MNRLKQLEYLGKYVKNIGGNYEEMPVPNNQIIEKINDIITRLNELVELVNDINYELHKQE